MNENTIFVNVYDEENDDLIINEHEIWRYSGYLGLPSEQDAELLSLLEEVKEELKGVFSYKVCYRRMNISWKEDMPKLPFDSESLNLAKCLKGSDEVIIFAATVGIGIDRLIAKYQRFQPTKALLMQAYGAERVECLCNKFCQDIEQEMLAENKKCSARFSPGYGDLPIDTQKDFFRLLDCSKQIGISLNDSLLMSPSKSVTAIFGVGENVCKQREHKCDTCDNLDCEYRK